MGYLRLKNLVTAYSMTTLAAVRCDQVNDLQATHQTIIWRGKKGPSFEDYSLPDFLNIYPHYPGSVEDPITLDAYCSSYPVHQGSTVKCSYQSLLMQILLTGLPCMNYALSLTIQVQAATSCREIPSNRTFWRDSSKEGLDSCKQCSY